MRSRDRCKVLVSAPYAMPVIAEYRRRLSAAGCRIIVPKVGERLSERELLPLVKDVDGIICGDDRITARVLAAAPRLKVISKWGTGIDSIDRQAAAARGVKVCNTPGAFTEPVADTVLACMLHFSRRLTEMDAAIRARRWVKPQLFTLGEKTLGIVGVGECGKAVARRARAFGMRLLGNDIRPIAKAFVREVGLEMAPLERLLRESDFVTLHVDLNPTSLRLINAGALRLMRRSAYLINISRGPVVDENALAAALARGRLMGAALDVFEEEPLPAGSPLRKLKNVLLAPHNANSSPRAHRRVHDNTIRNLIEGLRHA